MTIYDIARKTNLSVATISRVINNKAHVTEATRQKVLKAIEEYNYLPNALAVGLSTNKPQAISIMARDVSNVHTGKAVTFLESKLRELGYSIFLYGTDCDQESKERYIRESISRKVDAIIFVGSLFSEVPENSKLELYASKTPIILINGQTNIENAYCVVCDEYSGVKNIIKSYYKNNKKRILYLYDVVTLSGKHKLKGYQDGLKACKLPIDKDLIIKCQRDLKGAYNAIIDAIDKNLNFDSIICSEDILAVGTIKALLTKGIKVPDDIVVTGMNNSIISDCCIPSITSLDNKITKLCELAIESLEKLFKKESIPKIQTIQSTLVIKQSFCPLI
ncbi:MAG: LacI family transcriptional regulator [Clostridiales bacterium]|nr:LacI family transcriptional regulator [Clostridiales bacterium]